MLYTIRHKFAACVSQMAEKKREKNNLQLLQEAIVCYAVVPWQTLVHGMLLRDVRRHIVSWLSECMLEDGFLHVSAFLGHKVHQTKLIVSFLDIKCIKPNPNCSFYCYRAQNFTPLNSQPTRPGTASTPWLPFVQK